MARESTEVDAVERDLPEFRSPPLFETVFGVRFPQLVGWDVQHFGLYWDRIRSDYPDAESKPPLPGPFAQSRLPFGSVGFQLSNAPEVRCWFAGGDRLIQVQNDGFFHNWRKVTLEEDYPRYASIRPAFEREWGRFGQFLREHSIPEPDVVECEATYVNHFEKDREWSSMEDLGRVLRCWTPREDSEYLPSPSLVRINSRFDVPGGALDVSLTPATRNQDGCEVLQFALTVRGKPAEPEASAVLDWMDDARETIVRGFTDLTTTEMHDLWGRKK